MVSQRFKCQNFILFIINFMSYSLGPSRHKLLHKDSVLTLSDLTFRCISQSCIVRILHAPPPLYQS